MATKQDRQKLKATVADAEKNKSVKPTVRAPRQKDVVSKTKSLTTTTGKSVAEKSNQALADGYSWQEVKQGTEQLDSLMKSVKGGVAAEKELMKGAKLNKCITKTVSRDDVAFDLRRHGSSAPLSRGFGMIQRKKRRFKDIKKVR